MKQNSADSVKRHYKQNYHIQINLHNNNFFMYGYIAGLGISSVFEFGCNAGRHLNYLHEICGMKVMGVDVNPQAVKSGVQLFSLPIEEGDEAKLAQIATDSFDCCLTNSVLNHIKDIDDIVRQLNRIAKKYIVICETEVKRGKTWFIHPYESYGFEPVIAIYAEKVNAVYRLMKLDVRNK